MSEKTARPQNSEPAKVGRGHPPKEHQFKPGVSGNPGGVPKGKRISTWMAELGEMSEAELRKIARKLPVNGKIALARMRAAMNPGSKQGNGATEMILDRTEGKVAQKLEGGDGGPLVVQVVSYAAPKKGAAK